MPFVVARQVAERCSMSCHALQRAGSPAGWRASCSAEQPARGAASISRVWSRRGCTEALCVAGRMMVKPTTRAGVAVFAYAVACPQEACSCGDSGSCSVWR